MLPLQRYSNTSQKEGNILMFLLSVGFGDFCSAFVHPHAYKHEDRLSVTQFFQWISSVSCKWEHKILTMCRKCLKCMDF